MKFLGARSRMTIVLACMLVSVLSTAMMVGLVPDRESAVLAGRTTMCKTIAMGGSDYIARGEQRRLEQLLKSAVDRNDDLLSAGVRRANGQLNQVAERTVQTKETIQLPPARVLVADDGESNRKLLQLVLRRAGMEVIAVENGQLAFDAALVSRFDVILMDMQMPVVDGCTATTMLREMGYAGPIIALTAHAMQGNEEKCRAAGCSGYLTKPINIDRLLAMLAEVLGAVSDDCAVCTIPVLPALQPVLEQTTNKSGSREELTADDEVIECSYPLADPDFREIAAEFALRLVHKLATMRAANTRCDDRELAQLAHWLKGAGGTAGFDAFAVPAGELETAVRNGDRGRSEALIDRLAIMATRLRTAASTELHATVT